MRSYQVSSIKIKPSCGGGARELSHRVGERSKSINLVLIEEQRTWESEHECIILRRQVRSGLGSTQIGCQI